MVWACDEKRRGVCRGKMMGRDVQGRRTGGREEGRKGGRDEGQSGDGMA